MSRITNLLSKSSQDERLQLLLKICDVKQHIRNGNKTTVRDIAAVVGGDPDHPESFVIGVQSWLDEFKTAISRVALSSGFRSTGMTAALTHNSFLHTTDGAMNGIIFDELLDFNDPTGVLDGPKEVIMDKVTALTVVSGASTKAALRARNYTLKSALETELSNVSERSTRHDGGVSEVYGSDVSQNVSNAGNSPTFENIQSAKLSDSPLGRSTIVGPRLVYTGWSTDDSLRITVSGGLTNLSTVGSVRTTALVTSRYLVLGRSQIAATTSVSEANINHGELGGISWPEDNNHSLRGRPSDMTVCSIVDTDLHKLQAGPLHMGTNVGTNEAKNFATNKLPGDQANNHWGLVDGDIVWIPLSGLEDSPAKVYGRPAGPVTKLGDLIDKDGETAANAQSAASLTLPAPESVTYGSAFTTSTGHTHTIDINRYVKLARKYHNVEFDTAMIFDLTSVMSNGGIDTNDSDDTSKLSAFYSGYLKGEVTMGASRSNFRAVCNSEKITTNVTSLRRAWDNSTLIELIRGYDDYAATKGEVSVVPRALSEVVAGSFINRKSTINDGFRKTLVAIDQASTSVASLKNDKLLEVLKNSDILGGYMDGTDPNIWIGPDKGAKYLRVLSESAKGAVLTKWLRTLDYVALIAKMAIDYSDAIELN